MEISSSLAIGISEGSKFLPFCLACTILLRIARFPDVGIQGAFSLGAATVATLTAGGYSPLTSLALAAAAGAACGLLTATLYLRAGLNSLISGIVTSFVAYTATFLVLGASAVRSIDTFATENGIGVAGIALVIALVLLFSSRWGLLLRVAGASSNLLKYLGAQSDFYYATLLILGNVLIAVSGALVTGATGVANIRSGDPLLFIGITVLIMGEGSMILLSVLGRWCARVLRRRDQRSGLAVARSSLAGAGTVWYFVGATLGSYVYWITFVLAAHWFGANEYSPALFALLAVVLLLTARQFTGRDSMVPPWSFR